MNHTERDVITIRSEPVWRPVTKEELALLVQESQSIDLLPSTRDPAGVRNSKRVAKERARKNAAKKQKQHMRRCGK